MDRRQRRGEKQIIKSLRFVRVKRDSKDGAVRRWHAMRIQGSTLRQEVHVAALQKQNSTHPETTPGEKTPGDYW